MDKVLQLEDTTISGIEVGDNTFVLCKDNHSFSKIIVKEKSTVSGTITAEEIKYPTVSGSYIGSPTTLYPWVFWNESSHTNTNYYSRDHSFFAYNYDRVNGKYTSSATTHYDGTTTGNYWYPASGWTDNLVSVGSRNVIEHPLFYNSSSVVEILGKSDYIAMGNGVEGDITGYNKLVVGQATSGTTNTLTEINKSWVIDQFAGKSLVISDRTKLEEVKHIISNTSDTITVYDDFTTIPNSNTMFGIFDAVYVRCYHTGHDYSYSIRIA